MNRSPVFALRLAALSTGLAVLPAAASDAELAKQALNPIAALISLPMQLNYDENIGPAEQGEKWQLNVQPVIPFSIGADWNLISRTIVPLVSQQDVVPGAGTDSGVGDITQSLFFSPKKPTAGGWIWGVGPPDRRQVGPGSVRRGAQAAERLDRWRAGEPHLVGGRR